MSRLVEIWPGVMAHASGGLWLPASATLALADLHLGYGWAQRRKGELGPLVDEETRLRIVRVVDEVRPRKVLLVGDIVHARSPGKKEFALVERVLTEIQAQAELIAIRGNHDRRFASDFASLAIPLVEEFQAEGLTITHGDRLPVSLSNRLAIGHLHPAIGLEDAAGVRQRVPAFLVAGQIVVMPAFSPFAAGLDVWRSMPEEISRLSGGEPAEVIVATGHRVVKLGPLSRLVSPARGTRPRDYRASK